MNIVQTFRNAWNVAELRKKILFTLFIILIFRLGVAIPVPFLDTAVLKDMFDNANKSGNIFAYMDMISGGSFSQSTLFALSVTPYINASIIIQLLAYALPPLERMQKEGPEGRKKLNRITRYLSLVIALILSFAYYATLKSNGAIRDFKGFYGVFTMVVIILCFTAGASLIQWLGDQINEHGIGNGISIILFAGIIGRMPVQIFELWQQANTRQKYIYIPVVMVIFLCMVGFIILMNEAERRIPIQYAKRVVGRKMYGGQNTNIPVKVAMSGVMPIIFAMSFMSIPQMLGMIWKPDAKATSFWGKFYAGFVSLFNYSSWFYAAVYFLLIVGFNYFYVAMQYNPVQIANDLRQNNGGIPGIRPGRPTSDFIKRVLSKITLVGAFFLGVIAIFPIFFQMGTGVHIAMGGTSILIVVGVALETVRTLESQMMMRHHKGFLE